MACKIINLVTWPWSRPFQGRLVIRRVTLDIAYNHVNSTSGFGLREFGHLGRSKYTCIPNFGAISQSTTEILLLPVSENKGPPCWNFTSGSDFYDCMTIGISLCICLLNFVQIGLSASYYVISIFQHSSRQPYWIFSRVIADHSRSANEGLTSALKFRLDRIHSFVDDAIFVLWCFGLKLPMTTWLYPARIRPVAKGRGARPREMLVPPADKKPKHFKSAKNRIFCLPEVFCDQKVCHSAFSTPLPKLHPTQRLWRLHIAPQHLRHFDTRAFGARHLCPRPSLVPLRCFRARYTALPRMRRMKC